MKMKPVYQYTVNILLFLLIVFVIGTVTLINSSSVGMSELEQRDLGKRPVFSWNRLISGEYTRMLESYYSDRFAFRSTLVQAGSELKGLRGLPDKNGESIIVRHGDNTASNSSVIESDAVKYLITNDQAYTLFTFSSEAAKQYAAALNRFRVSIDSNIRVYSLLAPSSAAFLDHSKYRDMSDSQKDAFAAIYGQLSEGIKAVDVYSTLEEHRSEYTYFRTDHHWTALGAYYAYSELMKTMGERPELLSTYKKETIEEFLGSSYKATLSGDLKSNPDTIEYYVPIVDYKFTVRYGNARSSSRHVVDPQFATASNGYAVFLGGDFPQGKITTGANNGKRLLVVKDSYANALVPFLVPHFEEIDVIDPRHFEGSLTAYMKEHRFTDVLFLSSSTAARTAVVAKLLSDKIGAA
ncbi:DHHW family protein [Paenibacillus sp. N1-5-1-14]|uniref:DHHW family protein n=1 Tax=Paenibacillus radicibacter TaxID=2972488 RepID=UPI0021597B76|nr:DHHW family protein [Paenibacillus radicibacter]MCR8641739.1 DHHW family protein [Paenibacillus radicibacter]